ncbi:carbonic anhydrase 6 [Ctenodactylus gundi]
MRALVTLVSLLVLGVQGQHEWTYSDGVLDEDHWAQEYPACGGHRQSPIDLQRKTVQFNPSLKPLKLWGYAEEQAGEFPVTNNGHTVQISLPPTMRMTAPDGTEYIALQMHYHWGGGSSEVSGSEHTVDGIRRVIEIHVVHYNAEYESYDVAKEAPDGLAVLAAFVEIDDYAENTYYTNFINHLANIKFAGQSTTLTDLHVLDMLPEDLSRYYTYPGSLTTPPCTENVEWFVLADSVKLSRAQVWKVENSLLTHKNKTLHNGYRKTQPLHQRVVEANFRPFPSLRSEFKFYLDKIDNSLGLFSHEAASLALVSTTSPQQVDSRAPCGVTQAGPELATFLPKLPGVQSDRPVSRLQLDATPGNTRALPTSPQISQNKATNPGWAGPAGGPAREDCGWPRERALHNPRGARQARARSTCSQAAVATA